MEICSRILKYKDCFNDTLTKFGLFYIRFCCQRGLVGGGGGGGGAQDVISTFYDNLCFVVVVISVLLVVKVWPFQH